jgi:hypothetical protein
MSIIMEVKMVRNYARKTMTRYTEEDLDSAIEALRAGRMSQAEASRKFRIPSSLSSNVERRRGNGRPTYLSAEVELQLATATLDN